MTTAFYQDINLGGNVIFYYTTSGGSTFEPDLTTVGWNDKISSLTSNLTQYYVTVFQDINYGGNFRVFYWTPLTINNLSDYGFNDKISSFHITIPPTNKAQVICYKDNYNVGTSAPFPIGEYPSLTWLNFQSCISSITIFPSTVVIFYTGTNFSGSSWRITNTYTYSLYYWDLYTMKPDFNDTIQSIKVSYYQ